MRVLKSIAAPAAATSLPRFLGLDGGDWLLILLSLWVLGALLAFSDPKGVT